MKAMKRTIFTLLLAAACSLGIYAQENRTYILHTVEKGQSLYSISSMYGVSQADIVSLNPGSDEKIYVGRTLRIPIKKEENKKQETFHTIAAGETLYRLSVNYGISVQAICEANPGLDAQNFRTGQVIRIPAQTSDNAVTAVQEPQKVQEKEPETLKPNCRDMHKVKRKETVYSISREYGISEAELIAANPELQGENKLKRGSFLCIPYPKEKQEANVEQPVTQPQGTPTNAELFEENSTKARAYKTIKAALILPLLPEGAQRAESSRMVEYYEGFLMALDSLKRTGVSVDLYTFNSGPEKASLQSILARREMQDVHIIFGPLYQEHIAPLAEFAQKKDIRLVIPFTSKDNSVFRNPHIYQINTPQSYLYSEVYDHFTRTFRRPNVIFIECTEGSREKADFIRGLKDELRNRSIPMTSLKDTVTTPSLSAAIRPGYENIFIPTSGSNVALIKLLPHLSLTVRQHPETECHLFGYPEWQTYTKDHLEAFFELDTYIYSSFYTNNLLPAAVRFTNSYRRWFAKDMEERYPKYGMLGFDTGYYFLKGLSQYGNKFEEHLPGFQTHPIQTGFKFQRVNNWGGFINRKVFFVRFSKNYEVVKLDFD